MNKLNVEVGENLLNNNEIKIKNIDGNPELTKKQNTTTKQV